MLKKLYSLLGFNDNARINAEPTMDANEIVKKIRAREIDIPQGKQIYNMGYNEYILSLDREFTGQYRISVFVGNHKVYGFSVTEKQISDKQFVTVWNQIFSFLRENPSVEKMPQNELLQSHFFGNP